MSLVKIEQNLKYIGCDRIGFNRKMSRDCIGFSCEMSILSKHRAMIGHVDKYLVYQFDCRPHAGDPEKLS